MVLMKDVNVRFLNESEYEIWDEFVDASPQGNIFNKSYWLKHVCSNFDILVAESKNKIVAGIVLPYMKGKIYRNPKLTPQLGVLLEPRDPKQKYSTYLSREIELSEELIKSFPKFNQFDYNFSYNYTNFMPFIWNDFNVNVRYTYVIEDLSDIDKVYSDFQYDIKYQIKKAVKSNITVTDRYGIDEFYEINKKTFDRQKMQMPYTLELLKNIDEELAKRQKRKIFFAENNEGKIIAGVYIIYDEKCAYYLMGGADPEYRNMGAQALTLWEAIKFSSTVSKQFDFEGSMVRGIESAFRQYGGTQKIIYNVNKSNLYTKIAIDFARKNKNWIRKVFKV